MNFLLFLLDVPTGPRLAQTNWGLVVLVLAIVFILAVGFAGALTILLIKLKRRKLKEAGDVVS